MLKIMIKIHVNLLNLQFPAFFLAVKKNYINWKNNKKMQITLIFYPLPRWSKKIFATGVFKILFKNIVISYST